MSRRCLWRHGADGSRCKADRLIGIVQVGVVAFFDEYDSRAPLLVAAGSSGRAVHAHVGTVGICGCRPRRCQLAMSTEW